MGEGVGVGGIEEVGPGRADVGWVAVVGRLVDQEAQVEVARLVGVAIV